MFLNQQTAMYTVAQAVSQEVAGDPRLLPLSWVKPAAKTVCPMQCSPFQRSAILGDVPRMCPSWSGFAILD